MQFSYKCNQCERAFLNVMTLNKQERAALIRVASICCQHLNSQFSALLQYNALCTLCTAQCRSMAVFSIQWDALILLLFVDNISACSSVNCSTMHCVDRAVVQCAEAISSRLILGCSRWKPAWNELQIAKTLLLLLRFKFWPKIIVTSYQNQDHRSKPLRSLLNVNFLCKWNIHPCINFWPK